MYLKLFFGFICFMTATSSQAQTADLKKDINTRMKSYCDAVEERNAEKVISFYDSSKNFLVFVNGQGLGFENFTANVRGHLPKCKKASFSFDSLYITQINGEAVAASGIFHESFTEGDDSQKSFTVPATWILVLRNGNWFFLQATAFYQPIVK